MNSSRMILVPAEGENAPLAWERQEGESAEDYTLFVLYFLTNFENRSIRKSYEAYCEANANEVKPADRVSGEWISRYTENQWAERARLFDEQRVIESFDIVEEARMQIREATIESVQALRDALKEPRTRVAAAVALLDKGGIPSRNVSDVVHHKGFNADSAAQAEAELLEWEARKKKK